MAYTPQTIHDLRKYLIEKTGRDPKFFSVARTCADSTGQRKFRGYHLGKDQIESPCGQGIARDYSTRRKRDRRGLTDARSALDINLATKDEKALIEYLLQQPATALMDIREFIGPNAEGRGTRYARENDWEPEVYPEGNSHEWHVHISWLRDSEFRDKIALFEGLYGPRNAIPDADPVDEPLPEDEPLPLPDENADIDTLYAEVNRLSAENDLLSKALVAMDGTLDKVLLYFTTDFKDLYEEATKLVAELEQI